MAGNGASGGRNALSPSAHVVAGTFRADRHGEFTTPEPPKGIPEPPKPLDGDALEEWGRMVIRLQHTNVLSIVDDAAVYQYCQLFAEAESLVAEKAEARAAVDRLIESQGDVDKSDLLAFFQEVGKMQKLAASYDGKITSKRSTIRQYLVEFGLTPAARSRVKLPAGKPKGKLEQFRDAKG